MTDEELLKRSAARNFTDCQRDAIKAIMAKKQEDEAAARLRERMRRSRALQNKEHEVLAWRERA